MKIPLHKFFDTLFSHYGLSEEKDLQKREAIINRIIDDLNSLPTEKQKIDLPKLIKELQKKYPTAK